MAERYKIAVSNDLVDGVAVPENTQKKIKRNKELGAQKAQAFAEKKKKNKEIRHLLKTRTLKFEKGYRKAKQRLVTLRREARKSGNFFREPEPQLVFVTRISGINKLSPKPRKILQLLRLRQLHNGVFLKMSKPVKNMLKYVQPYITYGYPNLKTVRDLIYKRGYAKVKFGRCGKQRIPLSDNSIISDNLGQYGIHGVEDLIHEIYTVGKNFKHASNFLWPFKLSSPRKGFSKKRHGYGEPKGGEWGPREEKINDLIRRMN